MLSFNNMVGMRIQERLTEVDWTQTDLADHLGVTRQTVNKIIHGRKNITLQEIKLIADILKMDVEELVKTTTGEGIEPDFVMVFMGKVESEAAKKGLEHAQSIMDLLIFHRDINDSYYELFD